MGPIPADDITDIYIDQTRRTQMAISNVVASADNFLVFSLAGTAPGGAPMVNVDWTAPPDVSMLMLLAAADLGKRRYGVSWLQSLTQNLIRQAKQQ